MEPRHPGGSSSLRQRRRNPLASSLRVGSCGRLGFRRPRNSLGGRAGGPDPLAHPQAESFPMRSTRFVLSKRNLSRLKSKVGNGGPFGRTAPGWKERHPSTRCACCRPETRFWRPRTGDCSSRSHGFDPNYGPSPSGRVRSWWTGSSWVHGVGSSAESRCERGDRWNPKSRKRSRTRSPACPSNRRRRRSVGRRAMCPVEQRRDRSFTRERYDRNSCLSLVVLRMALHPLLLLRGRSEGISDRPEEHLGGGGAHVLELVLEILQ